VSGNFFEVLGVPAQLGRVLTPADDRPGGESAVITHGFWLRQFGGRPEALGASIAIDTVRYTIVGVLPATFVGPHVGRQLDFLVPVASDNRLRRQSWLDKPDYNWLAIMGRLKPDTSIAAARANLEPIFSGFLNDWAASLGDPESQRLARSHRLTLESAQAGLSRLRRQFSRPVLLLMNAVTLVLLIACVNVVNLLLARGVARQREIAVRLAIGARPVRLVRQLLTETLILGVIGGATGLLFAAWGAPLLTTLIADGDSPLSLDISPDTRVLLFTAAISLGSALLAGMAPALRAARVSVTGAIQGDSRTLHSSRAATWWSRALIASQVALSLLLLTGAWLVMTSLRNLRTFDAGFDRDPVLMLSLAPNRAGYAGERLTQYYREALDRVRATPGVEAASLSMMTPIAGGGVDLSLEVEGQPPEPGSMVYVNYVSERYFATMGTALVAGRDFTQRDGSQPTAVAVVNKALVLRYLKTGNPIGQRVRLGKREMLEVVGVVANAKYMTLREDDYPTIYVHAFHGPAFGLALSVRVAGKSPLTIAPQIRKELLAVAPNVPVGPARTLSAQVDRSLSTERLVARLLGTFAGLALVLASIGLYGVLGYSVTRRTNEIGVRLALGATRQTVLWSILRESWWIVVLGLCVGMPVALALTGRLAGLLYGVTASDPWALAGAVSCLLLVASVAALLPAWRASRVDPFVALRNP
jgi:predicted permease